MTEADVRAQDMEFRRRTLQQAAEQVRSVDLGDATPTYSFTLAHSSTTAAPAAPKTPSELIGDIPGSAAELAKRYRVREQSPVDVTEQALKQAEANQGTINAFITMLGPSALAAARASEERFQRGQPLGPLDGVPIAVK